MKLLCIRPRHNTPGMRDVTGAFAPEAEKFLKTNGDGIVLDFDNRKGMAGRRREVLQILHDGGANRNIDAVAFFCHGWSRGIQAGFTRTQLPALAQAVQDTHFRGSAAPCVVLYCCSTGDDPQDSPTQAAGTGDNSFADKLRDTFCENGSVRCSVMAHDTVAHCTKNPYALFFEGAGSPVGGSGKPYPVSPRGPLWTKWRKALRETDLRFRFPFMTIEQIHAELA